jgi:uncharacterized CHY-type Zn-finger protein
MIAGNGKRSAHGAHTSDSVTELDHFNEMLWLGQGCYGAPRWMRSRILSMESNTRARAAIIGTTAERDVLVIRCDSCATVYTRDYRGHSSVAVHRCRSCDRARLTARQKHRRDSARHRELSQHTACANCGAGIVPQRVTRRYCSTRCRVAASRSRVNTPDTPAGDLA